MPRPCIAVLGLFAADLTSRVPRLPHWHETLEGLGATLGPGGKASNQAIAAARLGAAASFIGKVGADPFGDMAKRLYDLEGVDHAYLATSASEATGTALILIDDRSGHNAIVVNGGATAAMTAAELDAAEPAIRGADVFLLTLEAPVPLVARAIAMARRASLPVVLNPAPAKVLDWSLLPAVAVVTPNEVEAAGLVGTPVSSVDDARRAAHAFRARGAAAAIVTLGERGAVLSSAEHEVHLPPFAVPRVVDTTGAGDAFNGALAVALAERQPLLEATRFASAAAALSVTAFGAATAMPRRAEVEALLRR
ncbi:MAG TPA: PfkB family carbohydrate kinase [Stellaceae bacterium]|nr:PfkB family carbohydrate kinase [Stellaceae bacterium]